VSKTGVFHGFGPVSDTFGSSPESISPFPVRGVWVLLGLVFGQLSLFNVALLRRFALCFRTLDGPEQQGFLTGRFIDGIACLC
jgi:hypothetical protein